MFTASFLWKDLLGDVKDIYFPKHRGLAGRVIFTILVTIILVILAIYIRDVLKLNQPTVTAIRFEDEPIDNEANNPPSDSSTLSNITDELGLPSVDGGVEHSGSENGSDTGSDTGSE